jgi:hypothetical protein
MHGGCRTHEMKCRTQDSLCCWLTAGTTALPTVTATSPQLVSCVRYGLCDQVYTCISGTEFRGLYSCCTLQLAPLTCAVAMVPGDEGEEAAPRASRRPVAGSTPMSELATLRGRYVCQGVQPLQRKCTLPTRGMLRRTTPAGTVSACLLRVEGLS